MSTAYSSDQSAGDTYKARGGDALALHTGPDIAPNPDAKVKVHVHPKKTSGTMKALAWYGKHDVRMIDTPRPTVTDPQDVVLRVTSTCICGSDLHLYEGYMAGMKKGDLLGHEFMGVVEEVGPEVKNFSKGDRAITCFDIGCSQCAYCKGGMFSSCDTTNPSADQEAIYGHRTGGFFGYSHLLGGWEGGQAQYVRVPFADTNCLKPPSQLSDNQVVLLSDILPTAWHANEMGEVTPGKSVAIWGAGPVGILAAHCALHRGASKVVLIDREQYRLDFARTKLHQKHGDAAPFCTINFKEQKVDATLREMFPEFHGPDVGIEAVGFHYAKSMLHTVQQKLGLETDTSDVINEVMRCVRKRGNVSIIGAYAAYANQFNIGCMMEKGLTVRGGQTPVQLYWHTLLDKIKSGQLDPTMVITHELPLDQGAHAYKIFNDKSEGCIKVVLKPGMTHVGMEPAGEQLTGAMGALST